MDVLWKEYNRIIKPNGCIALWAQSPFDKILACSNLKQYRYEWIIRKTHPTGFLNAKKMPMKAHENVLIFYKQLPTYNPQKTTGHPRKVSTAEHQRNGKQSTNYGEYHPHTYDSTERYPVDVLEFKWDTQKSKAHATQKPLAACVADGLSSSKNCTLAESLSSGLINGSTIFLSELYHRYSYLTG